jgi:hypothetical protein
MNRRRWVHAESMADTVCAKLGVTDSGYDPRAAYGLRKLGEKAFVAGIGKPKLEQKAHEPGAHR